MDKPSETRHRLPRLARWSIIALVIVLCLAVAVVLAINSTPGKRRLAETLSEILSRHPRLDFELTGLSGTIPTSVHLDNLEISDDESTVLIARDISLHWSLVSAGRRIFDIHEIDVREVEVIKRPPPNPDPKPLEVLKAIPNALRSVRVHDLTIARLALSEAVAGEPAVFKIDGQLTGRTVQELVAELNIRRTDAPTTAIALKLDLGGQAGELGLSAHVEDSAFLPRAMKLDGDTPFLLTLEGEGDAASWDGVLTGKLGAETFADTKIKLAMGDDIRIALEGSLHTTVLPQTAPLQERLGDTISFAGTGQRASDGSVEISDLKFSGDGTELRGQLSYDEPADAIDMTMHLTMQSLAQLLNTTQEGLAENAIGFVSLTGSTETPHIQTHLDLADRRLLEINGDLDLVEGYGFDLTVAAWPQPPLIPPEAAVVLAEGLSARIAGLRSTDGSIRIDQAILYVAGAESHIRANMDVEAKQISGDVELSSLDLASLSGLLPEGTAGIVSLRARIDGTESGWNSEAEFSGQNVAFGDAMAAKLAGNASASGESWRPTSIEGLNLLVDVATESFSVRDWSQPELRLRAEVSSSHSDQIQIVNVNVESDAIQLNGRGDYNIASKDGNADIDIARFDLAVIDGVQGTATARATVVTTADVPVTATVAFAIADPGGLPDPALALMSSELDGTAEITLSSESLLSFDAVTLQSNAMSATATGALNLEEKSVDAETSFRVPNLDVMSASAGHSVAGAIAGTASIHGPLDNMTSEFTVNAEPFAWDDVQVSNAALNGSITNLPETPTGEASLRVFRDEEELKARASFAITQPHIEIPEITLHAGSNHVNGAVKFNSETRRGEGQLSGDLDDLSQVGRLLGLHLAGQATMNAALSGSADAQRLDVNLNGTELQYNDVTAATIQAAAEVTDPFGEASGAIHVEGTDLHAGDVQLIAYSMDVSGDTERAELSANIADGTVRESRLTAETRMTASVSETWLDVTSLNATFEDHRIALTENARISRSGDTAVLRVDRLAVDDGGLAIHAERTGPDFSAAVTIESLPLALAHLAGGPPLEGTVDGQLHFDGPLAQPTGNGSLVFRDVRQRDAAYDPLSGELETSIAAGICETAVRLSMDDEIDADAAITLPVRFTLDPVDVGLDSEGELRGSGKATADLSVFPMLFDMQEHVLEGLVDANLTLAGTVSAPAITGETRIENARYENLRTGTILDDLRLIVEGRNRDLRVTEFSATDGIGGTLAADGRVDLAADGFPFSLDGRMGNLRVANRDTVSGHVDGTFSAAGSLDRVDVTGAVTIGPATVNIPRELPTRYPELTVIEVNLPEAETEVGREPAGETPSPIEIALDVACDIPRQVYVRSESMDTEWKGNLHVGGATDATEVTGTLTPVRGEIYFLDRTFTLQESAITLDGSSPPAPYLDINATTRTQDLTARLHLYGIYPDVELDLESEPALPEDEILAQLLFDRNLREITPFQAVQLAAALESMRGSDGLSALTRTSHMLGDFRVQMRRRGDGAGDTAVSVGRYLNEKVYVEVEQGLKDQTGQGKVEYQVTPEFSIEGRAGSEGKGSVGLFYKKDY